MALPNSASRETLAGFRLCMVRDPDRSDWATSEPRDVDDLQLAVTFPDFHGAASYALVLFYHIIKGTASQAVRDEGKISHGFIFGGGEHMPVRMSGSIKN